MPRSDRWPPKSWFWAFPALANFHLVLTLVLINACPSWVSPVRPQGGPHATLMRAVDVFMLPGDLFNEWLV